MQLIIRKATPEDIEKILNIYNYEVEHGVATFDLIPKTIEEWTEWFYRHNDKNHPIYVAEMEGNIAGYGCLSPYREKDAFKSTVELSLYVHIDYRQQGVATELMDVILKAAEQNINIHTIVSVITSGNEASIKLHEKYHFRYSGTLHQVGMKFGRYLDIDNYELKMHDDEE